MYSLCRSANTLGVCVHVVHVRVIGDDGCVHGCMPCACAW